MSIDRDRGLAYLKSQIAAGNKLPQTGNVFISIKDEEQAEEKEKVVKLARQLVKLGYQEEEAEQKIDWQWLYGKLSPGTYRIRKTVTAGGKSYELYAGFLLV